MIVYSVSELCQYGVFLNLANQGERRMLTVATLSQQEVPDFGKIWLDIPYFVRFRKYFARHSVSAVRSVLITFRRSNQIPQAGLILVYSI